MGNEVEGIDYLLLIVYYIYIPLAIFLIATFKNIEAAVKKSDYSGLEKTNRN